MHTGDWITGFGFIPCFSHAILFRYDTWTGNKKSPLGGNPIADKGK